MCISMVFVGKKLTRNEEIVQFLVFMSYIGFIRNDIQEYMSDLSYDRTN